MSLKRDRCLNCEQPVSGNFCAGCGQRNADYRVSFGEVLVDALDGLFQIDSRIARTVVPFLFRPGFLTREYNAGRRVRYSSPLRIYLLLSVAYFFALSLMPVHGRLQLGPEQSDGKARARISSKLSIEDAPEDAAAKPGTSAGSKGDAGSAGTGGLKNPEVHLGWAKLEKHIGSQIKMLQGMDPTEARRRAQEVFLAQASKGLPLMLPVFALLLKILYRRGGHFYIEHLTFALHQHAFVLFVLLLCLLPKVGDHLGLMALICYAYLLVALRTVYAQPLLRTVWKSCALLFLYSFSLLFGGVAIVLWTLIVI